MANVFVKAFFDFKVFVIVITIDLGNSVVLDVHVSNVFGVNFNAVLIHHCKSLQTFAIESLVFLMSSSMSIPLFMSSSILTSLSSSLRVFAIRLGVSSLDIYVIVNSLVTSIMIQRHCSRHYRSSPSTSETPVLRATATSKLLFLSMAACISFTCPSRM